MPNSNSGYWTQVAGSGSEVHYNTNSDGSLTQITDPDQPIQPQGFEVEAPAYRWVFAGGPNFATLGQMLRPYDPGRATAQFIIYCWRGRRSRSQDVIRPDWRVFWGHWRRYGKPLERKWCDGGSRNRSPHGRRGLGPGRCLHWLPVFPGSPAWAGSRSVLRRVQLPVRFLPPRLTQ